MKILSLERFFKKIKHLIEQYENKNSSTNVYFYIFSAIICATHYSKTNFCRRYFQDKLSGKSNPTIGAGSQLPSTGTLYSEYVHMCDQARLSHLGTGVWLCRYREQSRGEPSRDPIPYRQCFQALDRDGADQDAGTGLDRLELFAL